MKFKDLDQEIIDKARLIYKNTDMTWDDRMKVLSELFGVSTRTARKWCAEKLDFKDKVEIEPEQFAAAKGRKYRDGVKRHIITWAQNNTPIHKKFWENIKAYADHINADIAVIAGRYQNPTSIWSNDQESEEVWDINVTPYLDAARHDVHKYLSVMSDIKIQPTAMNPMSGLQSISDGNSCIFGSPKVQLENVPVILNEQPKTMFTTGAVTKKNYTDSKSGKQGEFHHTFGFVVVEIRDKKVVHVRQVTADDKTGAFSDLIFRVKDCEVTNLNTISGLVLGDWHYGHHDPIIVNSTFEFMKVLKPKHVILHDVFDGHSITHHDVKNPFKMFAKEVNGTNNLKEEIDYMLEGLEEFTNYENVVIVRSNHDDFLDRWLINENWKFQGRNVMEYFKYASILAEQYVAGGEPKGVIPALITERYPNFITLDRSTSYKVKGWEVGQHGDVGSKGSRGSVNQFRKLNTKIIVGHYHAPNRKDGAISVGTSTHLRVGYNKGASDWGHAHVIIHDDGKAQHLLFASDGSYTTLF